jgi:hypothetical protein
MASSGLVRATPLVGVSRAPALSHEGSHVRVAHEPRGQFAFGDPYWLAVRTRCHWSLSSAIHLSKTNWSCGSILVKKIPIPAFGRKKATLPRASRLSLL